MKNGQTFPTMPPASPRYRMTTANPKLMRTLLRRSERTVKALEVATRLVWSHQAMLLAGEVERASFMTCDLRSFLEAWIDDLDELQKMEHGRAVVEENKPS